MKSVIKISIVFFLCFHFLHIQPVFNKSVSDLNKFGNQKWIKVPFRTAKQKAMGYTGGETGQQAFCIAISPSDPDYLAIAIDTAAVYISKDGARSWELKRSGIMSSGVQSVAFDPGNPKILWAAGTNGYIRNTLVEGIYRTIDGGETWHLLQSASCIRYQAQNEYFAFDPESFDGTQHNTVYAATYNHGLLKTTDAGKNWQTLGFVNEQINAVILHPKNNRLLFLASMTGLYRSDNSGKSFRKIGGKPLASSPIQGLALNSKDQNVLYVAIDKKGIFRSNNGGESFKKIMTGIPESSHKISWRRLCISPADPNYLYADAIWGGDFPYWSHNGGKIWHASRYREPTFFDENLTYINHWFPEGFIAHPTDPNIAYHVTPVRKTTDGGKTWRYASEGISGFRRIYRTSIAFQKDNPEEMILFHPDHGCAYTNDGGDTFTRPIPPRQHDLGSHYMPVGAYEPIPGSKKVISVVGGSVEETGIQRICISKNNCKTWEVLKGTEGDYVFMAFNPQKPKVVYMGRVEDSMRSRDGGKTWEQLKYSIKAIFPGNGDIVYATCLSNNKKEGEVLRSDDQGDTWKVLSGKIYTLGNLIEIDVDPTDPDRLYAASDLGVWVFDGNVWSVRDERHGLKKTLYGHLSIRNVAVDPTSPNIIYAGQNEGWRGIAGGIFRSTDYGQTWENINFNFGRDLTVYAITVSPHDGTVWLATDYGNWKLPPVSNKK